MGVSLGASVLLDHLGQQGDATPIQAAATISAPFDLACCSDALSTGSGRLYGRWLLKKLQSKVRQKRAEMAAVCDVERGLAATNLREFDGFITAPVFGFDDANDYYKKCSSTQYLSAIRRPVLIMSSLDDPFHSGQAVPFAAIEANPAIHAHLTARGGHVGFVSGATPWSREFWAEKQAAAFLAERLAQ
jgi:predicted alpha/beta-fold hydrolase